MPVTGAGGRVIGKGRVDWGRTSRRAPYTVPVSGWTRRTLDRGAWGDSIKWGKRASWLAGRGPKGVNSDGGIL